MIEEWSEDIRCLRLPMPAFGGVNALLLGRPGRQAIVDTGMPGPETAAIWDAAARSGLVQGVEAVVCTHMHIDHVGQAGGLVAQSGAQLHMSAAEHDDVTLLSESSPERRLGLTRDFYVECGFPSDSAAQPTDYGVVAPFPQQFSPLEEGATLDLGGMSFEVLIGGGHSRAPACLISRDRKLLLVGDQLLAGSGPQIPVQPERPDDDPIGQYLDFLDVLDGLPDDMVVLPGHGDPIVDFKQQVARIREGHRARIARLLGGLRGSMTCREMVPLIFPDRIGPVLERRLPYLTRGLANYLSNRGDLDYHDDANGVRHFAATGATG